MQVRHIAKNVAWNSMGMVLPIFAAVIAIPVLMAQLGAEGFGVLSLVWLAVGYFSLLDLGLGRALTKYVAELTLEGRTSKLSSICATSLVVAAGIGCMFALLLWILLAAIQNDLGSFSRAEMRAGGWVALSLPLVVMATALRGVLEGLQKFKALNLIRGPGGALLFAMPALFTMAVPTLEAAVFGVVLVRLVMLGLLYYLAAQSIGLSINEIDCRRLKPLAQFGGWLAVSNFIGPIIVYIDRLIIGGTLGAAMLAYYSAPFEVLSKLIMVPTALTTVLFPLLSQLQKTEPLQAINMRYRAEKWLAVLFVPAAIVGVLLTHWGLVLWLGDDFAEKSTFVVQILVVGVVVNCLTVLPYTALQSYGKTRWIAMVHLFELLLYVPLLLLGAIYFGLVGAASAWALRALLDLVLMRGQMRRAERKLLAGRILV